VKFKSFVEAMMAGPTVILIYNRIKYRVDLEKKEIRISSDLRLLDRNKHSPLWDKIFAKAKHLMDN
jgi:hypothetical protein